MKYQKYLLPHFDTFAYCLIPTHFYFLVRIKTNSISEIQNAVGVLQSSYTKALNNAIGRHGSLFQNHTKAKHIEDETYLLTLIIYIHQNPVRSGLVEGQKDWEFSSYRAYTGIGDLSSSSIVSPEIIAEVFPDPHRFREFSDSMIQFYDSRF